MTQVLQSNHVPIVNQYSYISFEFILAYYSYKTQPKHFTNQISTSAGYLRGHYQ